MGNGSFVSGSCPYTKEKRWLPMGLFTNLDIFSKRIFFSQHLGPDAFSAVRGQWIRAKNIKDIKEHFSKLFRIANIFVQYKGLAQCFFNTKN